MQPPTSTASDGLAARARAWRRGAVEAVCADDDGGPKELYARLGFRPAWTTMELLLMPSG